jgi:hypothetical protein
LGMKLEFTLLMKMGKKWKMWGLIEIKIKYIRSSWNKSKVLDEIETPHENKIESLHSELFFKQVSRAGTAYWRSNFLRWPNRAQMGLRKDRLGLTNMGLSSLGLTRLPLAIVLFFNCCLLYLFNAYIIN